MNQHIAEKSLRDWSDAPAGAFAKAVRAEIDPHWGRETEGLKMFKVKVHGEITKEQCAVYDIEEFTRDEAEERARAKFERQHGDDWGQVSTDVKEVI